MAIRKVTLFDTIIVLTLAGAAGIVSFAAANHRMFLFDRASVFAWVVLPSLAIAFLLLALRFDPQVRANIATVIVSSVLSVYAAEALLYMYVANIWPDRRPADYDRRTPYEVVQDLRSSGVKAYPTFTVGPLSIAGRRVVPFASIRQTTTVACNESGRYLIYQSDELGFNNPAGLWSGDIDVAIIGDSYAFGFCVAADESMASIIRKRHPKTINLAIQGTGPLIQLGIVREYLAERRPKVMLWFFYEGNDLGNLYEEMRDETLSRYLEAGFSQRLEASAPQLDAAIRGLVDPLLERQTNTWLYRLPLVRIAKLYTLRNTTGWLARDIEGAMEEPFKRVVSEVKARAAPDTRLYLVYLPTYASVRDSRPSRSFEIVDRVARDLGVPMIDVLPALLAVPDPLSSFPFRRHAHYNADGHRIVAETVLRRLETGRAAPAGPAKP